ncbi:hypothetical protein E1264_23455, partial [Actinomadura sp. KC216]
MFRSDGWWMDLVGVELRGVDEDSLSAGESVPALDVGTGDFVHRIGAAPEWGNAAAAGFVAVLTGGMG